MFFFPELIEQRHSQYNGTISVYKQFGKYSLSVDNLTQSGGLLVPIWRKALDKLPNTKYPILNVLILGLGGGTLVQLIKQRWPKAKITAVEIDPVMVQLARKYFDITPAQVIVGDAFKVIYDLKSKIYDLILVDLYLGKTYPAPAKSQKFLNHLKRLLTPRGQVVFNRLNWQHNQPEIDAHIARLRPIFPVVTHRRIISNTLVFCSD